MVFFAGLALFLSALGVLFQDTANIMNHVLRMWYFLSPGLYDISIIPEHLRPIFRLNPLCELMTAYRDILMWNRMPDWLGLMNATFIGFAGLLAGCLFFKRFEGRVVQML
jgi:ABC-type polysaccharide/polyol phosphate export permease